MDISATLEKLIRKENLSIEECEGVANHIASGDLQPTQVAAFLVLLRAKGETGDELLAIARAMRIKAIKPSIPSKTNRAPLVDIVGTGGDGHDTVNLSTAAAIVAASCGAVVAKHGNRSASSKSGSADVLVALGIPMLDPSSIGECIDRCGIAFLFAPNFHPAFGTIGPIRKSLGIRTIFNILGPLLNPLQPRRMVLGVYSSSLLPIYSDAVLGLGVDHGIIVHCCGLDELACVGITEAVEVRGDKKQSMQIDPLPLCDKYSTIADLKGGDATHNANIIRILLGGGGGPELKPCFDTVAINAGAVLYVSGLASSIPEGFAIAAKAMKNSQALKKLDEWVSVSQEIFSTKKVRSE